MKKGATVNGLVNISITTLETRFGFESWMTGLMAVSYDIGFILVSLYVTFALGYGSTRIILKKIRIVIFIRIAELSNLTSNEEPM